MYLINGTNFVIDAHEDPVGQSIAGSSRGARFIVGAARVVRRAAGAARARTVARLFRLPARRARQVALVAVVLFVRALRAAQRVARLVQLVLVRLPLLVNHAGQDRRVGQQARQQAGVKRAVLIS